MTILALLKSHIKTIRLRKKFTKCLIYSGATLDNQSLLGDNSVLFGNVHLINSSVGAYSYIQTNSVLSSTDIGKFCSIASNVHLGLPNHPLQMVSTSPVFYDQNQPLPKFIAGNFAYEHKAPRTLIGSDVWIGAGVLVISGKKIGTGSVIGAGSVVTKDIPPYSIAAGNPCRVIKPRFSQEIVQGLLETKWWDLEDCILLSLVDYFNNPKVFLEILNKK
jgi:acetyltransferase-like isoleucine patch superfamily enzyme